MQGLARTTGSVNVTGTVSTAVTLNAHTQGTWGQRGFSLPLEDGGCLVPDLALQPAPSLGVLGQVCEWQGGRVAGWMSE